MFFIKAHGLGNDFVIFDGTEFNLIDKHAKFIADRKHGIGCDQIIGLIGNTVKFWNGDGSYAAFCGNGCRAIIKYLYNKKEALVINTDAGIVTGMIIDKMIRIKYPGGGICIDRSKYYICDVGNRHAVMIGSTRISNWQSFFDLVEEKEVNFMYLSKQNGEWYMDIYEFGAGETNGCGSGAMAAFLVLEKLYNISEATIHMKGGSLTMERSQNNLYQTGPAEFVFNGEISLFL